MLTEGRNVAQVIRSEVVPLRVEKGAESMATTDETGTDQPKNPAPDVGAAQAEQSGAAEHLPADHQFDARKAMGDRKRNAIWPEVHDAFDTRTAEVDERASGDPTGATPDNRPTGPSSLPE
jgi:hypothetical protein